MIVLGLCDGHDSGACLLEHGRLTAAVSTERFTRRKRQPGFPREAIRWCLERRGLTPNELDRVAVAERSGRAIHRGLDSRYRNANPNLPLTRPANLLSMAVQNFLARGKITARLDAAAAARFLRASLRREGIAARPVLVDHHLAHALSAARGSGVIDDALVLTMDAFGDGCSGGAWRWRGGRLQELCRFPFPHSPALLFGLVTAHLGLKEGDEGKVAGMAAAGDPGATRPLFDGLFSVEQGVVVLRDPVGLFKLGPALSKFQAADVAAGVQASVEGIISEVAGHWAGITGARDLCLAGGLFANVRLNQRAALATPCRDLYVFPHMGDGGLCVGAAMAADPHAPPADRAYMHMFLGPTPGPVDQEEARAVCDRVLPLDDESLGKVALALSRGGLAAVAAGRLEFGPRALGNRSILAPADDAGLARRLNDSLGRPHVMPLAPVARVEDLNRVTEAPAWSALREMTVTVDARPGLAHRCPVAVHEDGTMRLQVATRQHTPLLHRILTRMGDHMDPPLLINTSLNLHTEPIVRTARRALELYRQLPLDALILDDRVLLGRPQ